MVYVVWVAVVFYVERVSRHAHAQDRDRHQTYRRDNTAPHNRPLIFTVVGYKDGSCRDRRRRGAIIIIGVADCR